MDEYGRKMLEGFNFKYGLSADGPLRSAPASTAVPRAPLADSQQPEKGNGNDVPCRR